MSWLIFGYNRELKLKVKNVAAELNCSVFNTTNDKIQRIHTDKFAWNNHMHIMNCNECIV